MKKALFRFLCRAPVFIKEFGERRKWKWMAALGKSLNEAAAQKIKMGWLG
jgi:hypothetical protein